MAGCYPPVPASPVPLSSRYPLVGSFQVRRVQLTADQLLHGFDPAGPVDESALAPAPDAASATHSFEGVLRLEDVDRIGAAHIVQDDYDYASDPQRLHLPPFAFAFVQADSHLIPVQRTRIVTGHPYWDILLSPGRAWREAGDDGWTRAAIPFALLQKNQNCTHNGTLMFLFRGDQVSRVWYQITQETCIYFKADLWGLLPASYQPQRIPQAARVRRDFVTELNARLPVKPLAALREKYPDVDLTSFGAGISPRHLSLYGLVDEGALYLGPCRTRYGESGYCQEMRQASYSTAKAAFAGVALMRLAQRDGLGVKDHRVGELLPETASAVGEWSDVTLEQTLDMATGNFESSAYMADEDGPRMSEFFLAESAADKLDAALVWPRQTQQGRRWVYHTSDTYLAVRAMQQIAGRDLFDFVTDEVYRPAGLGPGAFSTARTSDDGWEGQAFGGYGLWWIADDVAKLASLMQQGGHAADGEQLLHPDLVAAAMQQRPDDRGALTGIGDRYRLGFWARHYTPHTDPAFQCDFWVPYMSGAGGITILLLPNGMTYFYFSDKGEFNWLAAVRETHLMRPHCREQ